MPGRAHDPGNDEGGGGRGGGYVMRGSEGSYFRALKGALYPAHAWLLRENHNQNCLWQKCATTCK